MTKEGFELQVMLSDEATIGDSWLSKTEEWQPLTVVSTDTVVIAFDTLTLRFKK